MKQSARVRVGDSLRAHARVSLSRVCETARVRVGVSQCACARACAQQQFPMGLPGAPGEGTRHQQQVGLQCAVELGKTQVVADAQTHAPAMAVARGQLEGHRLLPVHDGARLVELLGDDFDFVALTEVDEKVREDILEDLPPETVAEGVRDLESDDAVTILGKALASLIRK